VVGFVNGKDADMIGKSNGVAENLKKKNEGI
jgi:hypothetical protein